MIPWMVPPGPVRRGVFYYVVFRSRLGRSYLHRLDRNNLAERIAREKQLLHGYLGHTIWKYCNYRSWKKAIPEALCSHP